MTDVAERSGLVRRFLGLNALFSVICGVTLVALAKPLAGWLFVGAPGWTVWALALVGGGLVIFAADLALMWRDRYVARAKVSATSAADLAWVIGSAVALTVFGDRFTPVGREIVIGVAVAVAVLAAGQYAGARRLQAPLSDVTARAADGVLHLRVRRVVAAPVTAVWRVMTDHPGYADVASNIAKVEVVAGEGLGMQRRCTDPKGDSWLERCDLYVAHKEYGFTVDTGAPDYPYPIAALTGRWSVRPVDAPGAEAEFAVDIAARPKGNAVQRWLFMALAGRQFKPVLVDLAEAWAARMEREAARGAAA